MAGRVEHLITGQQADRVLGYRLALGSTQYFDVGYGAGAEVIYVAKNHSKLKKSVGFSIHVYFNSTQTTKIELAQMVAALQPDGSQVLVKIFKSGRAAHFQFKPETMVVATLQVQSPERFGGLHAGLQGSLALLASYKVFVDATPGDNFAAVGTGSTCFGVASHRFLLAVKYSSASHKFGYHSYKIIITKRVCLKPMGVGID
jgi:hypothetical protein